MLDYFCFFGGWIMQTFINSVFAYGYFVGFVYLNLNIFIYGLAIGYAIKVLPVLYSGVIFNLVYNSFNFKQACDNLDLVGSFTIVAVYVYKSVIEKL